MVHIRLDDKRIELSMEEPRVGPDDEAQVRLDAGQEKGTLVITMAGRQLRFSDYRIVRSTVRVAVLGTVAAPADWECLTIRGNRAVVATEAPMLTTLQVVAEGVAKQPVHRLRAPLAHIGHREPTNVVAADDSYSRSRSATRWRQSEWFVAAVDSTNETCRAGERVPGDRALNSDTAVRFRGVKVIFPSEPEIVDADGATDPLVIQDC